MSVLLTNVISAIDDVNSQDIFQTLVNGSPLPKELVYGQRMTACLLKHWPDADDLLQIAVRGQHIKRWQLKRSDFDNGKSGYYQWRIALGEFHGELTVSIMIEQGYTQEQAHIVASIIRKKDFKTTTMGQTLEDVACLVFLEHYFEDFAARYTAVNNEAKIIRIVQRTWDKMSEQGHEIALKIELPEHLALLVKKALAGV